jgi:uncharacterized protein DUF3175
MGLVAPGPARASWIDSGTDAKSPSEAASGTTQKRRKTPYDSGLHETAQVDARPGEWEIRALRHPPFALVCRLHEKFASLVPVYPERKNEVAMAQKAGMRNNGTARRPTRYWSGRVTETSNALDLDQGVFKLKSARKIAASLKRSAERSHRRKSDPYRSAMSMLSFYLNRAGKNLAPSSKQVLENAKGELRALFGRDRSARAAKPTRRAWPSSRRRRARPRVQAIAR